MSALTNPSALTDPPWCVTDAVLADGATVHIRPISPNDGPALLGFHARLSDETIYLRFFGPHRTLTPEEVTRFTNVDHCDRMALVATLSDEIIAVARYDRLAPGSHEAEAAFLVADAHQGRGLGTLLLEYLVAFARSRNIRRFVADTLVENWRMRQVFRNAGYQEHGTFGRGTVQFTLDIEPNATTLNAIEERGSQASVRSIRRLLEPRSIAVIGASHEPGALGHEIFCNLLTGDFQGPVYPVHPTAALISGVRAYPSLGAIPEKVDLAVVAVPAPEVLSVLEDCRQQRVHGLIIISAGFADAGPQGADLQRRIVKVARGAGMRMIGPNSMGVINTRPDVSMNATFALAMPSRGRVAFFSQSGGIGTAALEEAVQRGIGLSSFVSAGNKADVSGNDLLRYWQQDRGTDVVLLYLESFGNPQHFARVATEVSQVKPIIAVKAGRTAAGTQAGPPNTAVPASSDLIVDALFARTGVVRVDTIEELFDVAQLLASQPVPRGRRTAIVTNSGGPGILAADACDSSGLVVADLSDATRSKLRSFLPAEAGLHNPVDLMASGSAADYERTVEAVLADDGIDALLVIFTPTLVTGPDDVARAIMSATEATAKAVVVNFLPAAHEPDSLTSGDRRVPSYAFPETAVRALARAYRYGEWRARPPGAEPSLVGVRSAGRGVVLSALAKHPEGVCLDSNEVEQILDAYSIPRPQSRLARTEVEAVAAAGRIGYPVAVKAVGPCLAQSDVGGIRLDVERSEQV